MCNEIHNFLITLPSNLIEIYYKFTFYLNLVLIFIFLLILSHYLVKIKILVEVKMNHYKNLLKIWFHTSSYELVELQNIWSSLSTCKSWLASQLSSLACAWSCLLSSPHQRTSWWKVDSYDRSSWVWLWIMNNLIEFI